MVSIYMRISWGQLRPGQWDSYEKVFRTVSDPTVDGLVARWLTRDSTDGDALFIITLWSSKKAIAEWEASSAYKEVYYPALVPFLLGSYSVSISEVRYAMPDLEPSIPK